MRLADRMGRLGTETAFEVLARARALEAEGRDVIHLEVGEPDVETPAHVIEAGREALAAGWTHYGPAPGDPELRAAIAETINRDRGTSYQPTQAIVCPGAKPIMFFALLALVQAGDEVIYPDPGFPIYGSMVTFSGATPVPIPLREERGFALDVDELERLITPRTRMLIVNTPGNPTGGVIPPADLERIAALAVKHDLWVLSDEIYAQIIFEGEHVSLATFPGMAERTILLDGFSKTYAMTGWRLGYGLLPAELVDPFTKLMVNSVSCASVAVQRAGLAALTGPQDDVVMMREAFQRRRDLVVSGLNAIDGLSCATPAGAFYVFPNISATGMTSAAFAGNLLQEQAVATIAGTSFGRHGEGYIRLSTANSDENLTRAVDRIAAFVAGRAG
ncbi:MAG TPA: pyridoxal phosphate-dependent aminotransferase [Thermomicrobiales bacterium]|jgi:aspartate/methionine/tyrosine aminotransferase|nr:pyridoxal phosphate-dependent aminotransferase [Thermomicrobiales bacterium]